jgi:hypothetical protein
MRLGQRRVQGVATPYGGAAPPYATALTACCANTCVLPRPSACSGAQHPDALLHGAMR